MKYEKELSIFINDKQEFRLYEENKSIPSLSVLEFSIIRCPIDCNNCKIIYSNKPTGIRIFCKGNCHKIEK